VPEAVYVLFAAELATVTVVDLTPAEVGVKVRLPVVQMPLAVITAFAVQVPRAGVNSASEEANGVAPRVIEPPFAVRVTGPQVPLVGLTVMVEVWAPVAVGVN
jgi:hypothetical protein